MQFSHHQFQYAGFLRRLFAFILDMTLISLITSGLILTLFGAEYLLQSQQAAVNGNFDWRLLIFEHGLPALWVLGFWYIWMATPGKMLLDCQVVDAKTKRKPRISQLIIRYLGYIASAIPLGAGFLWILVDKKNQAWHDKLSSTIVIMQDASLQPMEAYK